LCTIDELDGYTFTMAQYLHPNDGPSPICPGANQSQTNNPTWFAFTAWCTNLTLRVHSTNCHQVGGAIGFQLAIYTNCNFNHTVACNADIQDCNTNDKILNLTGLNIGAVYYFMVDGCLGSYCTVTIDVVGVCGQEVIAPWTQPVVGNLNPCVGNSELYTVEHLNGARFYHWFLDGASIGQTTTDSFNIQWPTPGTYQLCIDASNDPCVPITDDPPQLCTNITVHESNAGILNASPTVLCPMETAQINSAGFTVSPDNTQWLLVTNNKGTIIKVINASSGTFTSDTSGQFTIYAYNFVNGGGTIPIIGSNINAIDCNSNCCDLINQTITFQSIQAIVNNISCDDHGTGNDSTDDTFTFEVMVTGSQVGSSWQSSDGTLTGTYNILKTFGPYLINAGGLSFDLHDVDVPTCISSISVIPPPACSTCPQTLDAGPGGILNCINSSITLNGTCSDPGAYQWTGPNLFSTGSLSAVVNDSGWYYLTIAFPKQCSATDSVFVDEDDDVPIANAGADQLIDCNHAQVMLDGSSSTGNNLHFVWTDVDGNIISTQSSTFVSNGGTYTLQLTNTVSGCTAKDTVEVLVHPDELKAVSLMVSPEICEGDNNGVIEITGITGGLPPYSFSLNGIPEISQGPYTNLTPGLYNIHIIDAYGCTLDTFLIVDPGIDLQITLPAEIKVTEEQSTFIHAIVNVPISALSSIEWNPKGILSCDTCLSTSIITLENQTLQLTITYNNGCVATATVNIVTLPKPQIYIPNTFSPNNDGINDFFTLYANGGVESILDFDIFDRWGEFIYQAHDFSPNLPESGWDGKFHLKEMPSGIFVYKIKVLMADGTNKILTGDVTLVR